MKNTLLLTLFGTALLGACATPAELKRNPPAKEFQSAKSQKK
jgi:hypothetical protein